MAASDEEVESFEITDFDLESELFPGRRNLQTKEEAIYGIWATEEERTHGTKRKKKTRTDYAEPMGFVSGGMFHEQDEQEDDGEGSHANNDSDDGDEKDEVEEEVKKELEHAGFPSSFISSKKKDEKTLHQDGFVDKGKKGKPVKASKQFGAWEKYTTGFGSKMLEKMGYKGGGMGKGGRGIQEPVQAFKRKGKGAIGAYGSEQPKPVVAEIPFDSDEEEEQEMEEMKKEIETLHQWKKTGQEVSKPKYVYKTADEVKSSGKTKKLAPLLTYGNVKVVDMTGPQTKVLQGYGSLAHQHAKPDDSDHHPVLSRKEPEKAFALPELEYNLNLLVELAESDIIQIDRQLRHERDNVVNLTHEEERLEKLCLEEEKEIDRLQHVLNIVNRCKAGLMYDNDEPLTLEGLMECFQALRENYYEEYKLYDLDKLVVPLGFPLMARHFSFWQPFVKPTYGIDVVKLWKSVLEEKKDTGMDFSQSQNQLNRTMGPFERLIWDVWMPHLRSAVSRWIPKECDNLISVMEPWSSLLPDWILANILDQLVMPKLQSAIDSWNPLMDPVPIHSWIHPWLPYMGQRMEPLYAPIRQKLCSALVNWYPSDPSAKVILEPWVKVFSKGTMEAFLLRSIYPKLEQCMATFQVNPHQQHLEPFNWVMSWKEMISVHHMSSIFDKHLFPKWTQVLRKWLSSNPNYDEVTKWYLGWKSLFPDEYLSNATIKEHFNRALSLMNQAVSGTLQPGAKENVAYLTSTERRKEQEKAALKSEQVQSTVSYSNAAPTRFKDLVEQAAEDNELLFIPIPNRRHEGKAVYSFGKRVIYIDRDVVFYSSEGAWKPTSLEELVNIAS